MPRLSPGLPALALIALTALFQLCDVSAPLREEARRGGPSPRSALASPRRQTGVRAASTESRLSLRGRGALAGACGAPLVLAAPGLEAEGPAVRASLHASFSSRRPLLRGPPPSALPA